MTSLSDNKLLATFEEHLERYSSMEPADLYKLAHQASLGVGHLVSSTEDVTNALIEEIGTMEQRARVDHGRAEAEANWIAAEKAWSKVCAKKARERWGD